MTITTLNKGDIFAFLEEFGWPLKEPTFRWGEMRLGEYSLPSRAWWDNELAKKWKRNSTTMGLVSRPKVYVCSHWTIDLQAMIYRSDADSPQTTCGTLVGAVEFINRDLRDVHSMAWSMVNDGGPEPKDWKIAPVYFDAVINGPYKPTNEELRSFRCANC